MAIELPPDLQAEMMAAMPTDGMPMAKPPADGTMQVAQDKVSYRQAAGPEQSCASCQFFDGQGACELVAPPIKPDGVCDLWRPMETPNAPAAPAIS